MAADWITWVRAGTVLNPVALNGVAQLGYGVTLSGPMTLGSGPAGPVALVGLGNYGNSLSYPTVTSVISDSNPAHPHPLVLGNPYFVLTFSPSSSHTYAGGTVVDETGNGIETNSNNTPGITPA